MKKVLSIATFTLVTIMALTNSPVVNAEETVTKKTTCKEVTGQYGSTTKECTEEETREKVLGETTSEVTIVNSGLGDVNFGLLSIAFGGLGIVALALSKLTKSVYLFE